MEVHNRMGYNVPISGHTLLHHSRMKAIDRTIDSRHLLPIKPRQRIPCSEAAPTSQLQARTDNPPTPALRTERRIRGLTNTVGGTKAR